VARMGLRRDGRHDEKPSKLNLHTSAAPQTEAVREPQKHIKLTILVGNGGRERRWLTLGSQFAGNPRPRRAARCGDPQSKGGIPLQSWNIAVLILRFDSGPLESPADVWDDQCMRRNIAEDF
jgi:hypothetical protein